MSVRVLFVCMGNICRSPTAHALFREAVTAVGLDDRITTDSAGTHAYHIGNPPDARATATALERDIDMTDLRARQVCEADFSSLITSLRWIETTSLCCRRPALPRRRTD